MKQLDKTIDERYEKALKSLDRWELDDAEEALREVLSEEPEHAHAINKLGVVHARREQFGEAERCFNEAITLDSSIAGAYSNLGNIYQQRGETHKAITAYETSIKLDPEYAVSHHNLGVLYKKTGRVGEGINMLKKAAQLDRAALKAEVRQSPQKKNMVSIGWIVAAVIIAWLLFFR